MVLVAMATVVVSIASVLIVRAYLSASTDNKINEFAPMTYTNIGIQETFNASLSYNGTTAIVSKDAAVQNLAGSDKKPVFMRVKLLCTVYDANGYNVSLDYSDVSVTWNPAASGDWTSIGDYYYYYRIVLPGESTSKLFASSNVSIVNGQSVPSGYTIHVDILADAVQAVSTDSARWKASDYTSSNAADNPEVKVAWGIKPATITYDAANADKHVSATVTWLTT